MVREAILGIFGFHLGPVREPTAVRDHPVKGRARRLSRIPNRMCLVAVAMFVAACGDLVRDCERRARDAGYRSCSTIKHAKSDAYDDSTVYLSCKDVGGTEIGFSCTYDGNTLRFVRKG
jgi:hypothetical protein